MKGGRIEICAKFQGAKGEWPAFWMLPEEGSLPTGGEIDPDDLPIEMYIDWVKYYRKE